MNCRMLSVPNIYSQKVLHRNYFTHGKVDRKNTDIKRVFQNKTYFLLLSFSPQQLIQHGGSLGLAK